MATFAKGFKKGGKGGKGAKDELTAGGEGPARGTGHTLPRTRVSAEKFTGVCSAWKGKYGWITPDEPIEHEKAGKHRGSIFFGMNDIEGGESVESGATVEFHIWEDDDGLGADEVVQTGEGTPNTGKAKGKGKDKGKTGGSMFNSQAVKGWSGKANFGAKGWNSMAAAWQPAKGASKGWFGKGAFMSKVAGPFDKTGAFQKGDGSKGKGKGGKAHQKLPKTRVSSEKFTGTVKAWKGKYGWITPSETIEHEKASKNKGDLYVSIDDLDGEIKELTTGALVEFHIFEDSSGLGAEEVVQY